MPTHGVLGRLADGLARYVLNWLHRRVALESREWLDALIAESECADDAWQRLRWALGAVPLVWTINQRSRTNPPLGAWAARIAAGAENFVAIAGLYAVIIPLTYAAAHAYGCQLSLGHRAGGCQEHPFAFAAIAIGGALLGLIIALAWRARFAAFWWAAFSAFNTVGSVWYLRSGIIDLPRYGATQSGMLMAATFGVVVAALVQGNLQRTDIRHRITAHLIAGTIGFALADSLIRLRDTELLLENVSHVAILASAMFAAILAGLIYREGESRLVQGTIQSSVQSSVPGV
jgi:hypothetical protein